MDPIVGFVQHLCLNLPDRTELRDHFGSTIYAIAVKLKDAAPSALVRLISGIMDLLESPMSTRRIVAAELAVACLRAASGSKLDDEEEEVKQPKTPGTEAKAKVDEEFGEGGG